MVFLSKMHEPQSTHKENIRPAPIEGHSTKHLTSTHQNCEGHQEQGKSEKLSLVRRAYGDMMTKCSMMSRMGPWNNNNNKERTLGKN